MNNIQSSLASCIVFTGLNIHDWNKGWSDSSPVNYRSSYLSGVLPATLISFKALEINGEVVLQWVIENEMNNSHFSLERSTDGINFTSIATIKAVEPSNNEAQNYIFKDKNAPEGSVYYRLVQHGFDGNLNVSGIININIRKFTILKIYPNHLNKNTITDSLDLKSNEYQLTLKNNYGTIIFSSVIKFIPEEKMEIFLPDIPVGIYILKIMKDNQFHKIIMVK
jgi:hypothetical protein